MKNFKLFFAGLVAVMLVSSCGMMNDGFSGSSIQKRKYTKGFYLTKNKSWSNAKNDTKSEKLEDEVFVKDQVLVLDEQTNNPIVIEDKTQNPGVKKNDKSDQSEDQKTVNKKEESKKVMTPEKKNNVPAPSKPRKERVPERYLPIKEKAKQLAPVPASDVPLIVLVILAILIPPLAVFLYEGLTNRFWIDLVLAILGYGIGFGLIGGLGGLFALIAIIYALLIVLGAI